MNEELFGRFATPFQGGLRAVFPNLSASLVQALTRSLLRLADRRVGDADIQRVAAVVMRLASMVQRRREYWRPDLGFMFQRVNGVERGDVLEGLVRLMLAYTEEVTDRDAGLRIEVALDAPAHFTFHGRFLGDIKSLHRQEESLELVNVDGTCTRFWIHDGDWQLEVPRNDGPLRFWWDAASPALHYTGGVAVAARPLSPDGGNELAWSNDASEAYLREALAIVACAAPGFVSWIGDSVTALFTYDAFASPTLLSGSASVRPGAIAVGYQQDQYLLAEQLVHEATHQYLYMLDRIRPCINGRDEHLYYSAIKKTERPLHATLAGYHAVLNMALFHHALLSQARPLETDTPQERFDFFVGMLPSYEAALSKTNGLSDSGEKLYRTLRETVCAQFQQNQIGEVQCLRG